MEYVLVKVMLSPARGAPLIQTVAAIAVAVVVAVATVIDGSDDDGD